MSRERVAQQPGHPDEGDDPCEQFLAGGRRARVEPLGPARLGQPAVGGQERVAQHPVEEDGPGRGPGRRPGAGVGRHLADGGLERGGVDDRLLARRDGLGGERPPGGRWGRHLGPPITVLGCARHRSVRGPRRGRRAPRAAHDRRCRCRSAWSSPRPKSAPTRGACGPTPRRPTGSATATWWPTTTSWEPTGRSTRTGPGPTTCTTPSTSRWSCSVGWPASAGSSSPRAS